MVSFMRVCLIPSCGLIECVCLCVYVSGGGAVHGGRRAQADAAPAQQITPTPRYSPKDTAEGWCMMWGREGWVEKGESR